MKRSRLLGLGLSVVLFATGLAACGSDSKSTGGSGAGGNGDTVSTGGTDTGTSADGGTLSVLNDEFGSSATQSTWSDLAPARHTTLDIQQSRAGFLTIVPAPTSFNAWYSDSEGPLYSKTITGDFVAEISVVLGTATDRTVTPVRANTFSAAGFVIRDPASVQFRQRWVMYNIGYQDVAVAREIKTTTPSAGGATASLSTLYLNNTPSAVNAGLLRVCRIGSLFRFFHRYPSESTWTEEVFRSVGSTPTRINGNGPRPAIADGAPLSFDRPDLPAAVQVGLMAGNFVPDPAGARGEFDYIRFSSASKPADCLAGNA